MTYQQISPAPRLEADFSCAVNHKPAKRKRMAPLSVRLSKEQRERLERDAMGTALNAYVLIKLFDDDDKPNYRRKKPTKRDKAVARALRRLGGCGITTYLLSQILAVEEGRLIISDEEEKELRAARAEVDALRRDLVAAMGLESEYAS